MKICLTTYAKQSEPECIVLTVKERLPERVIRPCELTCTFHVESCGNYYLLTLDTAGTLMVNCQRCLQVFQYDYSNQCKLAVCVSDIVAESLMEDFECIVAEGDQVDLLDILADELHLFAPEKHDNDADCDTEISRLIRGSNEIIPTTLGL